MIGKVSVFAAIPFAGMLFWLLTTPQIDSIQDRNRFSESVNLALRRTAHFLLLESGDSTSRIPAVEQRSEGVWSIQLGHSFDYDRLPAVLQESFALHQITQNYDVAVIDCDLGSIQLGYNYLDFKKESAVPCGGRELTGGCYDLQVTFLHTTGWLSGKWAVYGALVSGFLLATGFYYGFRPKRPQMVTPINPVEKLDQGLYFGNSVLDTANQALVSNGKRHDLTYRETKLLQLFASHPNQLLERDFILKAVWEDEGIMVGRSVDVFVSRLRKLLKADASVQLTAVHGVGYRLNC